MNNNKKDDNRKRNFTNKSKNQTSREKFSKKAQSNKLK